MFHFVGMSSFGWHALHIQALVLHPFAINLSGFSIGYAIAY